MGGRQGAGLPLVSAVDESLTQVAACLMRPVLIPIDGDFSASAPIWKLPWRLGLVTSQIWIVALISVNQLSALCDDLSRPPSSDRKARRHGRQGGHTPARQRVCDESSPRGQSEGRCMPVTLANEGCRKDLRFVATCDYMRTIS
jgi:hypothetical protein